MHPNSRTTGALSSLPGQGIEERDWNWSRQRLSVLNGTGLILTAMFSTQITNITTFFGYGHFIKVIQCPPDREIQLFCVSTRYYGLLVSRSYWWRLWYLPFPPDTREGKVKVQAILHALLRLLSAILLPAPRPPPPTPLTYGEIMYGWTPYQLYQVRLNLKDREIENVWVGGGR